MNEKFVIDWECDSPKAQSPSGPTLHESSGERVAANAPREQARQEVAKINTQVDQTRQKIAANTSLSPTERQTIDNKLRTMGGECKKIDQMIQEGSA